MPKLKCPLPGCPGVMPVFDWTRPDCYWCKCKTEVLVVHQTSGIYGGKIPALRLATEEEHAEFLTRPIP